MKHEIKLYRPDKNGGSCGVEVDGVLYKSINSLPIPYASITNCKRKYGFSTEEAIDYVIEHSKYSRAMQRVYEEKRQANILNDRLLMILGELRGRGTDLDKLADDIKLWNSIAKCMELIKEVNTLGYSVDYALEYIENKEKEGE